MPSRFVSRRPFVGASRSLYALPAGNRVRVTRSASTDGWLGGCFLLPPAERLLT